MRRLAATALALVALSLWACAEPDPTDPNEFELRWESGHLVLLAHEGGDDDGPSAPNVTRNLALAVGTAGRDASPRPALRPGYP